MLESDVSQDFIVRIDASQRALVAKMLAEKSFIAPSVASFAIGELDDEDTRAWTYSSNAR